jgi:CHAT domain-containing protein
MACHGVSGGPTLGQGVCVAAHGLLPPRYLNVAADPVLRDYVLTWDDVIALPRSPDLLISVACSSGRTTVGTGGTRLGLEQGMLTTSTRYIVAPLWSVAQHSSLTWLEAFLNGIGPSASPRDLDISALHRAATLMVRDRHPHPYHWAPYVLTTALRGVKQ